MTAVSSSEKQVVFFNEPNDLSRPEMGPEIEWFLVTGVPKNRWFLRENPDLKWMMTGGTSICGNPHISTAHFSTLHGNCIIILTHNFDMSMVSSSLFSSWVYDPSMCLHVYI